MTLDLEQSGDVASTVVKFAKGCAVASTLTLKVAVCELQPPGLGVLLRTLESNLPTSFFEKLTPGRVSRSALNAVARG